MSTYNVKIDVAPLIDTSPSTISLPNMGLITHDSPVTTPIDVRLTLHGIECGSLCIVQM